MSVMHWVKTCYGCFGVAQKLKQAKTMQSESGGEHRPVKIRESRIRVLERNFVLQEIVSINH